MSLIVDNLSYNQALRSIREIILDTNPVQCFNVSGQDFLFKKGTTEVALDSDTYTFSEVEKFYDLMNRLRDKDVTIEVLPDFVSTEYTKEAVNFNYPSILEAKTISRGRYFSDYTIEKVIEDFYAYYCPYFGVPRSVQDIFSDLDYFDRRKLVFWVAYYLVDKKRMNYATSSEIIRLQTDANGEICGTDGELKNTSTSITTRVGEVFSVTEKEDNGSEFDGFTSFWGDKYSYYTKLQLWIRDRFEKQFKDFSLRDDAMISQSFTLEKGWENMAWVNTMDFSRVTTDIMNTDYRV